MRGVIGPLTLKDLVLADLIRASWIAGPAFAESCVHWRLAVTRPRNGWVEPSPADAFDKIVDMSRDCCASMSTKLNLRNLRIDRSEFAAMQQLERCKHHSTRTEKVKNRKFL